MIYHFFITKSPPDGLEDVSKFPHLFAKLIDDGWPEEDLIKLAGGNLLRVLDDAERISKEMSKEMAPIDDWISEKDLDENNKKCRSFVPY